jgi:hypothetical protein
MSSSSSRASLVILLVIAVIAASRAMFRRAWGESARLGLDFCQRSVVE